MTRLHERSLVKSDSFSRDFYVHEGPYLVVHEGLRYVRGHNFLHEFKPPSPPNIQRERGNELVHPLKFALPSDARQGVSDTTYMHDCSSLVWRV